MPWSRAGGDEKFVGFDALLHLAFAIQYLKGIGSLAEARGTESDGDPILLALSLQHRVFVFDHLADPRPQVLDGYIVR